MALDGSTYMAYFLVHSLASSWGQKILNDVNHLCTDQVLVLVSLVDPGDLGHEGVVRVGVAEQGADRKQHLVEREGEGGTTTMRRICVLTR